MADRVQVTPADLRSTAEHLADVSRRMKGVLSALNGELAVEGQPWGTDKTGKQFTGGDDGSSGYVNQRQWVDDSVRAKTTLLDDYAKSLREAADTLEQQDGG